MPATSLLPQRPQIPTNRSSAEINLDLCLAARSFTQDILLHRLSGHAEQIGRVVPSTIPTTAERSGDFSALLGVPLYRTPSGTVATSPGGNTPITTADTSGNTIQVRQGMIFRPSDHHAYAGNLIPTDTFDPAAASLLDRYPQPTSSGLANNFKRLGNEPDNQDQFDVRIDHRFTERDQFFARYSYFKDLTATGNSTPRWKWRDRRGSGAGPQDTPAQSLAGNYVHCFLFVWLTSSVSATREGPWTARHCSFSSSPSEPRHPGNSRKRCV